MQAAGKAAGSASHLAGPCTEPSSIWDMASGLAQMLLRLPLKLLFVKHKQKQVSFLQRRRACLGGDMGAGTQPDSDASRASWEPGRVSGGTTEDPVAGPNEDKDPAVDAALAATAYTVACSGTDALRFLWAAFGGPSCVLLH